MHAEWYPLILLLLTSAEKLENTFEGFLYTVSMTLTPVITNTKKTGLFLLQRLDIVGGLGLDVFHHLLVSAIGGGELLLKSQPFLEEEAGLLGAKLLALFHRDCALLGIADTKDTLKQATDLFRVTGLDLQVKEDIPEINALGERGQQSFEDSATTFDITVSRAELQLSELRRRLNMRVRRQRLQSTRQQSTATLGISHGIEKEGGVVEVKLGRVEDLFLESSLEELIRFL
jgi:hypothetical protein